VSVARSAYYDTLGIADVYLAAGEKLPLGALLMLAKPAVCIVFKEHEGALMAAESEEAHVLKTRSQLKSARPEVKVTILCQWCR
jgi:hypothetical protein